MLAITGFHHVTVPTADALSSGDWYTRVFGFVGVLVEERENAVEAVLLEHPSGGVLYLRQAPRQAAALRGFGLVGLGVETCADLSRWADHLTGLGVRHHGVRRAHLGWALTLVGPDEILIQLHTRERLSGEDM